MSLDWQLRLVFLAAFVGLLLVRFAMGQDSYGSDR